ncbi:MAG: hypothetical protein LBQ31_02410 [Bacteroidales bacterium]|nr:hypothetical protein [Bacteroidales bacterium]
MGVPLRWAGKEETVRSDINSATQLIFPHSFCTHCLPPQGRAIRYNLLPARKNKPLPQIHQHTPHSPQPPTPRRLAKTNPYPKPTNALNSTDSPQTPRRQKDFRYYPSRSPAAHVITNYPPRTTSGVRLSRPRTHPPLVFHKPLFIINPNPQTP